MIQAGREENMMGKLVKVLKAIGRFVNRAITDMAADRPGGGMATSQERIGGQDWEDDLPPALRGDGTL